MTKTYYKLIPKSLYELIRSRILPVILLSVLILFIFSYSKQNHNLDDRILSYKVEPKNQLLKMYWKDDQGNIFHSINNLKIWLEKKNQHLLFAMNGGMFNYEHGPQGLYIENYKLINNRDTSSGGGNFYMKPNGIFYLTSNGEAEVCKTENFQFSKNISYATQSGPMLVIDGKIHPSFKQGSANLNIRNGVGILPDNKILFAMSKKEINFYDFADFFLKMGCKNALYLDGFVSRTYLPEKKWIQTDGNFGVIIAVTKNK